MTTPSALNTTLAEESLGRCQGGCTEIMDGRVFHSRHCPVFYVPAVALALQSKDDSAGLEIDRLKAELVEAQSEIAARRVGWHKTAFGDGWVFAKQDATTAGHRVSGAGGWTCHAETWTELCNSQGIARAALQTDGEKL